MAQEGRGYNDKGRRLERREKEERYVPFERNLQGGGEPSRKKVVLHNSLIKRRRNVVIALTAAGKSKEPGWELADR